MQVGAEKLGDKVSAKSELDIDYPWFVVSVNNLHVFKRRDKDVTEGDDLRTF